MLQRPGPEGHWENGLRHSGPTSTQSVKASNAGSKREAPTLKLTPPGGSSTAALQVSPSPHASRSPRSGAQPPSSGASPTISSRSPKVSGQEGTSNVTATRPLELGLEAAAAAAGAAVGGRRQPRRRRAARAGRPAPAETPCARRAWLAREKRRALVKQSWGEGRRWHPGGRRQGGPTNSPTAGRLLLSARLWAADIALLWTQCLACLGRIRA